MESDADYITPAIFLLNKFVKEKTVIINSINCPPGSPLAKQKAEAQAMISQFGEEVGRFAENIKPLGKKISGKIHSLLEQQKFIQEQPPQMIPLSCPVPTSAATKNVNSMVPLIPPKVNGMQQEIQYNGQANFQNNNSPCQMKKPHGSNCPFCHRKCISTDSFTKHLESEHKEYNEVYQNILRLTPEFIMNDNSTLGGNRQCFYCNAPFRSCAPLFRHIQEKHVEYFEIFIQVFVCKGQSLKAVSNIVHPNRLNLPTSQHPPPRPSTCEFRFHVFHYFNSLTVLFVLFFYLQQLRLLK